MTTDTDIPLDANEADVAEQRRSLLDDDMALPDELPLIDANPADVLDQHLTVPIDDDEWRASPVR
ncbi:MAG: hypothetical protein WA964_02260 [Ilumatobacter sp.]|uniref:hypothetical protein n=1 Tax=Ilumatobacter sp. TaxID=1967498 RepID=UPI003C787F7A